MFKVTRFIASLFMCVVVALVLPGCGGSMGTTGATDQSASETGSPGATAQEQEHRGGLNDAMKNQVQQQQEESGQK